MGGGMKDPKIAVLLPCYNEEAAIGGVIEGFRAVLPDARIYVYDNDSTDRTVEAARQAGALVRAETRRGKGNVVRRMFADIEADAYVMADGDGTYDTESAPAMIRLLIDENLDMVVGTRTETGQGAAYRPGHRFGNRLFTVTVQALFGRQFSDILSGYRVFSRRFVKSFPCRSQGFEIETELTVHSLDLRLPVGEVGTPYSSRPEGSESKLNSVSDGFRILGEILWLLKGNRPLMFFGFIAALFALLSIGLAVPLFVTYTETGLVPRFPTAVLSTGIMILSFLSLASGLILDSVSRGRREAKALAYLSLPSIAEVLGSPPRR